MRQQPSSFNPRPGHSTGATLAGSPTKSPTSPFQSAPRSLDRGDTVGLGALSGRALFQSAPRSLDRGDARRTGSARGHGRFNPRPGHSTGATGQGDDTARDTLGFNPRPGHSTGATKVDRVTDEVTDEFQSAPRSLDRGDACMPLGDPPTLHVVSIRAPVTRPGRRRRRLCRSRTAACFNPRPGHSTGATRGRCNILAVDSMFQSAPRSLDRGDATAGCRNHPG